MSSDLNTTSHAVCSNDELALDLEDGENDPLAYRLFFLSFSARVIIRKANVPHRFCAKDRFALMPQPESPNICINEKSFVKG